MTNYYECNITMQGEAEKIRQAVEGLKWKFYVIDGDPNLREGVKCYATRQFNYKLPFPTVLGILAETAKDLGEFEILRKKVELVLYDSKLDKVELDK